MPVSIVASRFGLRRSQLKAPGEEPLVTAALAEFVCECAARQDREPVPERGFGFEPADVSGHAKERELERFSCDLFLAAGHHEEITEKAIEIESEELMKSRFLAARHAMGQRGDIIARTVDVVFRCYK